MSAVNRQLALYPYPANDDGRFRSVALQRRHTAQGDFHGDGQTLRLAYPPFSDLDGIFAATCLETGELLHVRGWLYTAEVDEQGLVVSLDGSTPMHRVLHDKLADCHPAVAALIRDWGHRDPIDAMQDARLLVQAFAGETAKLNAPEVSHCARRAYADWTRDYTADQRDLQAVQLAETMTEWADAVLHEVIEAGNS